MNDEEVCGTMGPDGAMIDDTKLMFGVMVRVEVVHPDASGATLG